MSSLSPTERAAPEHKRLARAGEGLRRSLEKTRSEKASDNGPVIAEGPKRKLAPGKTMTISAEQLDWAYAADNDRVTGNPNFKVDAQAPVVVDASVKERTETRGLTDTASFNQSGASERLKNLKEGRLADNNALLEEFYTRLGLSGDALDTKLTKLALELRTTLDEDAQEIGRDLQKLQEPHINELNRDALQAVWADIERHTALRVSWIEKFHDATEALEVERKEATEREMTAIVPQLTSVAFLLPHDIERLMEGVARDVNTELLKNRQVYLDLAARLQIAEVEREKKQRAHFVERSAAWGQLHHTHARSVFQAAIDAPEVSYPPARRAVLDELRAAQRTLQRRLLDELHAMNGFGPPTLTEQHATAFTEAMNRVVADTREQHARSIARLRECEATMVAQCLKLVQALRDELLSCGADTAEGIEAIVASECTPQMNSRAHRANALIDRVAEALANQLKQTERLCNVAVAHVKAAATLWDGHNKDMGTQIQTTDRLFKEKRAAHLTQDEAQETELDHVLHEMREARDPAALSALQQRANALLDVIQQQYRDFRGEASAIMNDRVTAVDKLLDAYSAGVCRVFRLTRNADPPPPEKAPSEKKSKDGKGKKTAKAPGGTSPRAPINKNISPRLSGTHVVKSSSLTRNSPGGKRSIAAVRSPREAPAAASAEVEDETVVNTAAGTKYYLLPPDPESAEFQMHEANQAGSGGAAAADVDDGKSEKSTARSRANSIKSSSRTNNSPRQDNKKSPRAGSVKGGSSAKGARRLSVVDIPAAESDSDGDTVATSTTIQGISVPVDNLGEPCIEPLAPPEPVLTFLMRQVRRSFVEHADVWAHDQREAAARAASTEDERLADELEGRVRAHQPRKGRVEYDVSHARTLELKENNRRLNRHLKIIQERIDGQSKLYNAFAQDAALKLAQFTKGIDTRIEALARISNTSSLVAKEKDAKFQRERFSADLEARITHAREQLHEQDLATQHFNHQFEDAWRSFQAGGSYNDEEIAAHRAQLENADALAEAKFEELSGQLSALKEAHEKDANAALAKFGDSVKLYQEDLVFTEKIAVSLGGTNVNIRAEMASSQQAAASIASALDALEALVELNTDKDVQAVTAGGAAALLHVPTGAQWTAAPVQGGLPLALRILAGLLALQETVNARGAYLKCILRQPRALPLLFELAEEEPPGEDPVGSGERGEKGKGKGRDSDGLERSRERKSTDKMDDSRTGRSSTELKREKKPQRPSHGGKSHGSAKGSALLDALATHDEGAHGTLLGTIQGLLAAGRDELTGLAEAYYAGKGQRRITQAKIQPDSGAAVVAFDEALGGILETAKKFSLDSIEVFRQQLVRFSTLMTGRGPSAVFRDVAAHVAVLRLSQRAAMEAVWREKQGQWEKEKAAHVLELRPLKGHPNSAEGLTNLHHDELDRIAAVQAFITAHASGLQRTEAAVAKVFHGRLSRVATSLLALLDATLTAADLTPPPPVVEVAVEHKSLRKLIKARDERTASASREKGGRPSEKSTKDKGSTKEKEGQHSRHERAAAEAVVPVERTVWPHLSEDELVIKGAIEEPPAEAKDDRPNSGGRSGGRKKSRSNAANVAALANIATPSSVRKNPRKRDEAAAVVGVESNNTPVQASVVSTRNDIFAEFVEAYKTRTQESATECTTRLAELDRWKDFWVQSVHRLRSMNATGP